MADRTEEVTEQDRQDVAAWLLREADDRVRYFPQRRDGVDALMRSTARSLLLPDEPAGDAESHRDALADTGDAYTSFHGWTLRCLWCEFVGQGDTKAEAVAKMEHHYCTVLGTRVEIR